MCWATRDSAADLWLVWREIGKGGRPARRCCGPASRGIRPRQGVARFEISDVQTLFWLGNRGCGQQAILPALLDARYGVGNRLFPGEIIVTEMEESSQVVGMNHWNR